eukprot:jgi/Mesvir1/2056/Mv02316-RA.1
MEDAAVKKRLLTRMSVSRGEPPVRKLAKRYMGLVSSVRAGVESEKVESLYQGLLKELSIYELQVAKCQSVCDTNKRDQASYSKAHQKLLSDIAAANDEIELLKVKLEKERIERGHKEEFEAIRKLCAEHPSKAVTLGEIGALEADIRSLEAEDAALAHVLDLRKKQFALLLHTVDELSKTLEEEDLATLTAELRGGGNGLGATSLASQPMAID